MSGATASAILDRVLEPAGDSMPREAAEWLIRLRADSDLQARVDELADRNTEGTISTDELAEYDLYLQVAEVVAMLQAKARKVIARHSPA